MVDCRDRIAWTRAYRTGMEAWEEGNAAAAEEAFRHARSIVRRVMARAMRAPDAVEDLLPWAHRSFRTERNLVMTALLLVPPGGAVPLTICHRRTACDDNLASATAAYGPLDWIVEPGRAPAGPSLCRPPAERRGHSWCTSTPPCVRGSAASPRRCAGRSASSSVSRIAHGGYHRRASPIASAVRTPAVATTPIPPSATPWIVSAVGY